MTSEEKGQTERVASRRISLFQLCSNVEYAEYYITTFCVVFHIFKIVILNL